MKRHTILLTVTTLALATGTACSDHSAAHTASTGTPTPASGDQSWLAAAHQANLAEIQAGELAKKKGATAAVRAAGAMLITDHVASDAQVTRVAKSLKLTLPSAATPPDAAAASRLSNETGAQFDNDFTATMMTGHQKLIGETQNELAHGTKPQIKALAQSALPILRKHLTTLEKAAAS